MDENRKKLYDQLSAQWDMGTFDEFDNDLDNEDNQRVAWQAVGGQDGYGDFDMFRQAIQRSPEQTEQPEQPQAQPQWVTQDTQQDVTDVQDQPNTDGVVSDDAATGVTEEKTDDADVTDTTETAITTPTDVTSTSTDAVETGNVEPVQQTDYSSMSLDELKRNMGAMPGHELTQRDIDSRVTYINALADPAARQAEMDKLNLSIAEWDRRAERMREAQRESAIVNKQNEKEQAAAVRELNENNQYLADEINATLKKDTTADTSGTSEFSRGMSEPKLFTMFNDTIRKIRSDIKSWTDERLRQELTNRTFDNNADSMERAVLNVAIAKELEARARGEHATTVGEDNFAEYIDALRAIDPQRALVIQQHADAYDKALQGHTSSAQDHGDTALDDNPSYAVPRLAFELLKQRRAALSKNLDTLKRGAPGGTTTAAIEAMGYMQMLRDEDYTECFRQAEQLFGLDKIAGYNAQIMRKFDESMGEAVSRYQREAMDTFMEIVTEDMKPSDNWSYIFSYVLNNNFISKSLQAMNGLLGGPVDFPTVYATAMDKYSKENSKGGWNIATQIAAPTATFLVSAGALGQFWLPNIAGRSVSAYALRALSGGTEEGLRSLARDGVVKFGLNVLGASANFAAFGVQTALEDQLATGNFDAVKLITAGLEEGLKGAAFGTAGGMVGKIFERSTGWKAYMGEAAKVGTEIGAFTGMGYLEAIAEGKDGLTLADIGTNIGIVIGSKGAHFKSWAKDVKARAKNEGIYGKKVNYHEISDREREELDELGYHGVGLALKGTSLDEEQAKSIKEELEQMRQDKRVPWELVRCADWVLNGRVEVPPAVAKADIKGNAVDGYTITAVDANGRAIRGGVTVKGNDAKNAMVKIINKEAELARYAEREQNMMSAAAAREQARCAMQFCADSEGRYPDVSAVMNIFSTALAKKMNKEQLGDVEREVLNGVGSLLAISEPVDVVGERRKLTNEAYNVDLDKAIKKDAAERTDAEKAAIDDYNAWLDRNKDLLSFESDNFKSWVAGTDPTPTKLTHFEASDDIAKAVRERLDKWGEKVDTSNVVIVNSFDEVTDEEARKKIAESERRGSKGYPGWYDKGSGKVFLYLPHIVDGGKDVDVTIMHELVSHKGLRGLMNRPGQFEAFCDEVWKGMSEEDKEKYWKYPADERNIKTEQDRQRLAADEYVARLSERTDPEGLHLWNKLVALLHKVTGIDFKSIGLDARLREEIRKSYREMRKSRKQSDVEQAQASEAERRTEEESEPIVVGTTEKGEPTEGNGEPVAVEHGTDTTPTESEPTPAPSSETPTADATPAEAEGDGTTGNVNIHSELPVLQARAQTDGRAVDTHDIRELYPNDIDGITEEELPMYLALMEESRKQAHDYAHGLTDQRPQEAMWKYWATRDGLKDPETPAERHLARPKNKPAQTRRGSLPKTMQNGPRMSEERQGETEEPPVEQPKQPTEAPGDKEFVPTQEDLAVRDGETLEDYEKRLSNKHLPEKAEYLYVKNKYSDIWQDLTDALTKITPENAEEIGESVSKLADSNDAASILMAIFLGGNRQLDPRVVLPFLDGVAKGRNKQPEQTAGAGAAYDAEAERRAAQEADPYYMPMENKGGGRMSPNYRKATAEQIYNHLNDRENETHRGTLDGNIAAGVKRAEDKLKEVRRKEPKGEKRSDEAMDRWEKELAEAQAQADKWHEVERMRQQQKDTEGDQSDPTFKEAYDEYTSSDEEPTDLETYVARHLYGTKFKWKDKDYERMGGRTHGLGGHLGLSKSEKERRGFFGWIDENNGSYPESVAESLQANMPDWMRERYDTSEVLDAVLSVVGSNPRPRDMVIDYAKRLREQQRGDDEQYAEREAGERGFSSASDMEAYDNMRERENAGFHDVAAAERDEASERADRIADARARLNDPNASEFEKQAARTVLRFRFIGEIGAANRDGVDSGERIKNRDIADEMERAGKDARAIKLATGWERGKDGKWRYEEPDLALNDEQFMKFVQHNGTAIYWGKLGELVGDNELFEAYPQLKDLTIYSNTDGDNQYDPKHNEIGLDTNVVWSDTMRRDYNRLAELNESLEDHKARAEEVKDSHPRTSEILLEWAKDDQRAIDEIQEKISWMRKVLNSTLAHEVQHAIQEIEGFAKGGSPRDFGGAPDEMVVGQAIADRMAADRVIEDGDTIGTLREKFNERKGKEDFDTKNERRVIADAIGIMSEGYSPKDVRDLYAKEEKRLWDMYHDYSPESANGKYNRLAGEVESRNVSKRMNMTDEQRRGSLAEDTEDVPRDEQIVRQGYDGVNEMGSRVNKRMGEIGKAFENIELSNEQRAVVDVYSGKRNNVPIVINRSDGSRRIIMRQGFENEAGTKYSIFRHYEKNEGFITSDDIAKIPEVLEKGEMKSVARRGKTVFEYKLTDEDGVTYTVVNELNKGREEFANFYSDKKASSIARSTHSEEARADIDNALSGDKGSANSSTDQTEGAKTTENSGVNFRVREEEERDREYADAVAAGDKQKVDRMLREEAERKLNETLMLPDDSDVIGFKYHRGPAPKKTRTMYAVLNVSDEGLRAAYAGNKVSSPIGVWLDAVPLKSYASDYAKNDDGTPSRYVPGDTGKSWNTLFSEETYAKMMAEDPSITKSTKWLYERGGKHGTDVPNFSQMNKKDPANAGTPEEGAKTSLPHNKLIFEIECGMDENGDLTEYVNENGRFVKGKNQGLDWVGENKFYFFKTNPNAFGNWGIAGTFRIKRLVPYEEVLTETAKANEQIKAENERIAKENEGKPKSKQKPLIKEIPLQRWIGGYHPEDSGITVESIDALYERGKQMKLLEPTYDDNGNLIPLSQRFDVNKNDIRFRARDDDERREQTHSENFKRWFGDWENDPENSSKVVDENGEPKVVLHGTPNKDFYAFDPEKAGSGTDVGWLGKGFYFYGNAPQYASQYAGKGGRVLEVYLDIKNPYYASVEEFNRLAEANDPELSKQFREHLEEEGYDGVYYNGDLNEEWVAFRPEQIKSATENNGDFSRENPDIRYRLRDDERAEGVTLFSGGGLIEAGLKGVLDPRAAVEYDKRIAGVYRDNHGNHIVTADVRDVDPMELAKKVNGPVQYFHASPVCKNFSPLKQGGEKPLDIETAQSTANAIEKMMPRIVTIENVARYEKSDALKFITDKLDDLGYKYDIHIVDAADYGAATHRRRLILRAVAPGNELPAFPEGNKDNYTPWYDRVSDLVDELPETDMPDWMAKRLANDGIDWKNVDRPLIVMGGSLDRTKAAYAWADEPAPTIVAGRTGDRIVLPGGKVVKANSRVLARLMGLDDNYTLPESESLAHTVLGNGVPVELTKNVIGPLVKEVADAPGESGVRFRTRDDEQRPTFYSNAERAVEGVKQEKATGEQWKAMLTKAGGIKAGEDKWMGLSDWLDEHKGDKLTKDEVLQFVRDNGIQMREVNYSEGLDGSAIYERYGLGEYKYGGEPLHWTEWFELSPDGIEFIGNKQERLELADIVNNKDHFVNKEGYDFSIRGEEERYIQDTEKELFGFATSLTPNGRPINSTRLNYTTNGLENKREIAFVLPDVEPYQERDSIHFGPENEGKAVMWVRFGETTDADGNRVLVIDEIQSNRHQDAREKGYREPAIKQRLDKAQKEYSDYGDMLVKKYNVPKKDVWDSANAEERQKIRELRNALTHAEREYRDNYGIHSDLIPAAPFEKNWHEVAMKRMLRLAADEGFDKVAWTTGEQQAERYGIGGVVESITKGKTRGENTLVSVQYKNGKHDSWVVAPDGKVVDGGITTGENLSDLIGKELSEKVMSLDENGSISGDGLRIGGEGMKGFYDEMLPRFMNKYGKKWGAKVGEVELSTPGHEVMHSVDVTPEMKESVEQGQPLFRFRDENKTGDHVGVRKTENGKVRVDGLPGEWDDIDRAAHAMQTADPEHMYVPSENGKYLEVHDWRDNEVWDIWRGKPGSKRYENWRKRTLASIHKQVPDYAKKLGLDVELIDNEADVPAGHENEKSWYDPETGKIHIVVPRHAAFDTSDVMSSLWHEGVARHGLRKLVGDENYKSFLENVYNTVDKNIRDEIDRLEEMTDGTYLTATEEYLSRLAEQMGFQYYKDDNLSIHSWMQRGMKTIRENFDKLCRSLGMFDISETLRDDDLRTLLYNSYHRMRAESRNADRAKLIESRNRTYVEEARRRLADPNASEFEKQAARVVINAYGRDNGGGGDTPGGLMFRTRDDADMLVDMVKHNNEIARQRRDAVTDFVKAVTDVDELTDSKFATALGKVMRGQRQYDQDTVKDITDMAKAMVDAGMLSGLDDFAVKQMLTKIKDSTGKNDITAEANKLIDLMLKHQLKKGKSEFEKSLKVKGMKQDSRGVVVQGGLDYHGQRMVKALKEGLSLGDLDAVNQRIDEAEQRLSDPDEVVRGNAKDELDGLYVARQYFDQIKQNEIAEAAVKQQLEQAKQDHKNGTMSDEAYKQFRQACEEALRSLRCERVDAWSRLNETIGDRQGESAERAKQFRDQQKQRKEEIQHWANSDMEGHSADPHENETKEKGFMGKVGDTLHSLEQWLVQPLGTFDMLMRYFGNAHPKGEGYLFGFVRRFMNQRDQWFKQRKADFDKMDQAAMTAAADHSVKIKDWAGIYSFIKKLPKLTITVKGKDYQITQGNAVYLLAMENQADGRMKLRAMGLTEADMERLRGQVNPMLLELSDWVVKELLPSMRPRLNQTHIRMFGADMTDIPNYFPIRTSALARNETVNLAQQGGKIRPATITGSVIERKRNNTDLDLSADFFQVTAEHIDEMEHWNSFAEYARDLNTLLSYNRFRAQVNNLHSWRYGDGKEIWKTLEDTAAITTGDYQPKTSTADTTVNTAIQGLAAANITFRPFTALKQLLSFPVYFVQARWDDMGYALANLKGTWQWAIDNLPTFAERWQGRMAGDPILTQAEQERGSQNRRLRWLGKAGFAANAAVDAMTVAIGARSIYRTKLRRYKEMGYSEEEANKRALEDAAISVNETQQSGLGAFTSVIQQDRTFFSRMVTLYRNASMGYQRQLAQGLKAMRNSMSKEWRDTARAKVQKKLERDGIDSATAAKVADRLVNRENLRGLALAAMFGSIAPFVWSLGAQYLGYKMAGGDDDEQENQMLAQAATHLLSGWAEGIVGGSTVSSAADFIYDYINGRKKLRDYSLQHDLLTDMSEKILGKSSSKPADAVYDIVNMLVAMGTGVNPKSIVEPVVGIIDVVENWGGDAALAHEVALGFCRVLNVPQTSLDKVYVDEIGLTAREAQNLTAEEFAERWCRYKRRRGAGYLSPLTSEESDKETEKKLLQRYERMMDERFESLSDERVEKIMDSTDDKLLKKHAAKAYKSRIDALTDDDVQSYLVPLSDSAPQDSLDTKRDALSRGLKAAGYGSQDKPRSEQGEAYLRQVLMDDIIEDSALVNRAKPYEKVAAEYRKLGGKRDGKQWKRDPQKKGTDRDARKAYKDAHKAELEKAAIVEMKKAKIDELKKKLLDPKADKRAIMDKIRKLRKEAMDALE